jgi:hypothetical protein
MIGDWLRVGRLAVVVAVLSCASISASCQSCPSGNENFGFAHDVSTLHGTLIYHDELRQWLGVKLDQPACGESEIQLVIMDHDAQRHAKTLRGCGVTVTGKLYLSPTGYYSANLAIEDNRPQPDRACQPFPLESDTSLAHVPPYVSSYHVSVTVDYRGKGHVDVAVWRGKNKQQLLRPWQAYADYDMVGDATFLWLSCARGFRLLNVSQTPPTTNGIFEDEPGTGVSLTGEGINVVSFTCRKQTP